MEAVVVDSEGICSGNVLVRSTYPGLHPHLQLTSVTISSYLNSVAIQQFLMVGKNRLCLLQALAIATVMVNPSSVAWKVSISTLRKA